MRTELFMGRAIVDEVKNSHLTCELLCEGHDSTNAHTVRLFSVSCGADVAIKYHSLAKRCAWPTIGNEPLIVPLITI